MLALWYPRIQHKHYINHGPPKVKRKSYLEYILKRYLTDCFHILILVNMSERISRKYNGSCMTIYLETVLDIIVAGLTLNIQ